MSGEGEIGSMVGRMPLGVILAAALAGCAYTPRDLLTSAQDLREQTPFTPIPVLQSWINAPGIVMVMQRGLRGESEQRVALVNQAPVAGENVIIMRSRAGNATARLDFYEFVRWAGGAPSPFEAIDVGELLTGNDETGTYFWVEQSIGEASHCVFGIRRLTSAQRLLPDGATSLDILLRNCVRGDPEEALAPLLGGSVSAAPIAGVEAGQTSVISPLAGPIIR